MVHYVTRRRPIAALLAVALLAGIWSLGVFAQPEPAPTPKGMRYNGVASTKPISIGGDLRVTVIPPLSWLIFSAPDRRTYVFKRPYQETDADGAEFAIKLYEIESNVERSPKIIALDQIKDVKTSLGANPRVADVDVQNGFHQVRIASGETMQLITSQYQKDGITMKQVDAVGFSNRIKVVLTYAAPLNRAFDFSWPKIERTLMSVRLPGANIVSRFGGLETALVLPVLIGLMVLFIIYLLYWWWSRSKPSRRRYFKDVDGKERQGATAGNPDNYDEDPFTIDHWTGEEPEILIRPERGRKRREQEASPFAQVPSAADLLAKPASDRNIEERPLMPQLEHGSEPARQSASTRPNYDNEGKRIPPKKLPPVPTPTSEPEPAKAAIAQPEREPEPAAKPNVEIPDLVPKKRGFWSRMFGSSSKAEKAAVAGATAVAAGAAAAIAADEKADAAEAKRLEAKRQAEEEKKAKEAEAKKAKAAKEKEVAKAKEDAKAEEEKKSKEHQGPQPKEPLPKEQQKQQQPGEKESKPGFWARLFGKKAKVKPDPKGAPDIAVSEKYADRKVTDEGDNKSKAGDIGIAVGVAGAAAAAAKLSDIAAKPSDGDKSPELSHKINPTMLLSDNDGQPPPDISLSGTKGDKEQEQQVSDEAKEDKKVAEQDKPNKAEDKKDVTILTEEMARAAKEDKVPEKKEPPTVESEFVEKAADELEAKADDVAKEAADAAKDAKDAKDAAADKAEDAKEAVADKAADAVEKAEEQLEETQEAVQDAVASTEDDAKEAVAEKVDEVAKVIDIPGEKLARAGKAPNKARSKEPRQGASAQEAPADDSGDDAAAYLTLSPSERTELTLLLDQIKGNFTRIDAILAKAETKSQKLEQTIAGEDAES